MLQINFIRENKELVVSGLKKKYFPEAIEKVEEILQVDLSRRETQHTLDLLQSEANQKAKAIGELMKAGKKDEAELEKKNAADLRAKTKELSDFLISKETELESLLVKLPNLPHSSVPEGRTPEENVNIYSHGSIPILHDGALPHWELIKKYDIIDFELGVKITGAGFPVYKNKGARLQRALINFFLDEGVKAGYIEVQPPIMVNEASGFGTGQKYRLPICTEMLF